MTVKQLIDHLQGMPQNAPVGFADHDAPDWWVSS